MTSKTVSHLKDGKAWPLTTQIVSQYDVTATVAVVSAELLPPNLRRKYVMIKRLGGAGQVYLGFGINAESGKGYCLYQDGDYYKMTRENLWVGNITAITSAGVVIVSITEGSDEESVVTTFQDALLSSSMLGGPNLVYLTGHDQTNANALSATLRCGQQLTGANYNVWRLGLIFATGDIIPAAAKIQSARLRLMGGNVYTGSFRIQDGQPLCPHIPIVVGDYDMLNYAGDGGSWTLTFGVGVRTSMYLNSTGLGWIQRGAGNFTKLCLRHLDDVNSAAPVGDDFADCGDLTTDFPQLEVTWLP